MRIINRIELFGIYLIYFVPLELLETYNHKVDLIRSELVKVENFYFR